MKENKEYKEKRFGKAALLSLGIVAFVLSIASFYIGIFACVKMTHWAKFVILAIGVIVGLFLLAMAVMIFIVSFSLINTIQSVRDLNQGKGTANVRLCDKCGRVISKTAFVCEHCGAKQQTDNVKVCSECKTNNNAEAEYCEKCGHEFEE